jgi:hypothetical protein
MLCKAELFVWWLPTKTSGNGACATAKARCATPDGILLEGLDADVRQILKGG